MPAETAASSVKIVSLAPSFTEILESCEAAGQIVGVTDDCPALKHDPARLGSTKTLDLAKIETLRPDLILADHNENRPEALRELAKKFKVVSFAITSIHSVAEAVSEIGCLAGCEAPASRLAGEILSVILPENKVKEKVRTLILLWNLPFLTVNRETYPSLLVEAAGGYNVFHEDPVREIPIELEDMIDNKPAAILLASDPYPFTKSHVDYFEAFNVFSHVKVRLVDGYFFSRFGPRTVSALKTLRHILGTE
jgi:ABC-type hemin transport system substrate-binding protein